MSDLPEPEAPGPAPGQPGHFAHHDWLTAAVEALDAPSLLYVGATTNGPLGTAGSYVKVNLDQTVYEVNAPHALQGSGDVVAAPGWVHGLYLVSGFGSIGAQGANPSGARAVRLLKNGSTTGLPAQAQTAAAPGNGRPTQMGVVGVLEIAAGDVLTLEIRQESGGALDYAAASCYLMAYRLVTL